MTEKGARSMINIDFVVNMHGDKITYPINWGIPDDMILRYGEVIHSAAKRMNPNDSGMSFFRKLMPFLGYHIEGSCAGQDQDGNKVPDNDSSVFVRTKDVVYLDIPLTGYDSASEIRKLVPLLFSTVNRPVMSPFAKMPYEKYAQLDDDALAKGMLWDCSPYVSWIEFVAHCAMLLSVYDNDIEASLYKIYGQNVCRQSLVDGLHIVLAD